MTAKKSKFLKPSFILSTAILLLLLVGLPIGSWYYLQRGLEYRQSLKSDLKDYGKLPVFELETTGGELLTNEDIAARMVLAAFLDFDDDELLQKLGETLGKLHDQFDERNDLAFLMHLTDPATTQEAVERFAETYELVDPRQCYFVKTNDATQQAKKMYDMPTEAVRTHFALTDTTHTVRRHYDIRLEADVKRLVEHIALILPQGNERKTVSNRDSE